MSKNIEIDSVVADTPGRGLFVSLLSIAQHAFERIGARRLRRHQAQRDAKIAAFIGQNGGRFTDDLERQISRRFGNTAG